MIISEKQMRKSFYILALILLALCGCASTSSEDHDGSGSVSSQGETYEETVPAASESEYHSGIWSYGHYRGAAYSAAKESFKPAPDDVVEVYCWNTDFTLRRSLEEAVAEAFEAEGIKCVKFSDYSAGKTIEELSDDEYLDIQIQAWLDGVEYYLNIAMSDGATYTLGGGLADAVFEFSINTGEQVLSGSLHIEETTGNEIRESYLTSLAMVSKLAGTLTAKEYLEHCAEALEAY